MPIVEEWLVRDLRPPFFFLHRTDSFGIMLSAMQDLDKNAFIEESISRTLQFWVRKMLILGIILFPFIGVADYFVTPENFKKFLVYRFIITSIFIVFFFLNKIYRKSTYQYTLISTIIILSAVTIELMILSFGGHTSTYYAGLNLLNIAAIGLIPFSLPLVSIIGLVVYAIYLVPILLFDTVTNYPVFLANNVFMLSTYAIAITWRISAQKTMLNELSLQYELSKEKNSLVETVKDRTSRLDESQEWYRAVFDNATDGIMILDPKGTILNANERACQIHGFSWDALVGTNAMFLETHERKQEAAGRLQQILKGVPIVYETVHYRKDANKIILEVSAKLVRIGGKSYIHLFLRDMTEKKKIESHLLESQKMESIAVMAGGLAHDLNNVLTAIIGNTTLVKMKYELDEKGTRMLTNVEQAGRRGSTMIGRLMAFARKKELEIVSLDLNGIIKDSVSLMGKTVDRSISIDMNLKDSISHIDGDITQLEQVLMNLIVNARDAMPLGGSITISTDEVDLAKERETGLPPYIPDGQYVTLSVKDTGTGIPDEIKDRVFEPFFTTKERGKGTGLGLATVYGIVQSHRGYITLNSKKNEGSDFTIYFPASPRKQAPLRLEAPSTRISGKLATILVVDDDEEVLTTIDSALRDAGYSVIAMSNAMDALEVYKQRKDEVNLVVTDITMPLMDGMELIQKIREIRKDSKVLPISGYVEMTKSLENLDAFNLLQKPFDSRVLLRSVRRALESDQAAKSM